MELRLIREPTKNGTTLGALYVDKVWQCWTLEDAIRPEKIQGETCIPEGKYKVILDESIRFQRLMPHIISVPNFTGIRIHYGNTRKDTEGCILVGKTRGNALIGLSKEAFGDLFLSLRCAKDEITIKIENP
jgi:hypothetical protein